jgi:heptosyltransferase-2
VLLIGGEAEQERLPRLLQALPSSRIELARNLPLSELAQRLAGCAAFLGHDSGITHLAAAVGLPALVLWGDSAEAIWRPQAEKLVVLKEVGGLEELPVSRVLEAVAEVLRSVSVESYSRVASWIKDTEGV